MPSSTRKKDLYLGKSLGDLNTLAEQNLPQATTSAKLLTKSAEKVFKNAEDSQLLGDEERAYVLFMKFLSLVQRIKKTPDYKKDEQYFMARLGRKNIGKAIDAAENLSGCLRDRYDLVEAEEVKKKLDALDKKEEEERKIKEEEEQKKQENLKENQQVNGETGGSTPGFVSVEQLYKMMSSPSSNVLIMDVRSAEDFSKSSLVYNKCISVPAEIVPPGSTVTKIEKKLSSEALSLWNQRASMDYIMLMDWKSRDDQLKPGTPLASLKDALFKWDSTTVIRSEPLVVTGGYKEWLLYYPTLTTNANAVSSADVTSPVTAMPSLDFDYPDFDAAFREPEPANNEDLTVTNTIKSNIQIINNLGSKEKDPQNSQQQQPGFDRTLKPSLISNTSQSIINDLDAKKQVPANNLVSASKTDTPVTVNTPNNVTPQKKVSNTSVTPVVDRNSKPVLSKEKNYKEINISSNLSTNTTPTNSNQNLTETVKAAVQPLVVATAVSNQVQDKKEEVDKIDKDLARLVAEHKARHAQVQMDREKMSELSALKKQQEKEVADLMRMKRKAEEELKQIEEAKKLAEAESALRLAEQTRPDDTHDQEKKAQEEKEQQQSRLLEQQEEEKRRMLEQQEKEDQKRRLLEEQEQEKKKQEELAAAAAKQQEQARLEATKRQAEEIQRKKEEEEKKSEAAKQPAVKSTKDWAKQQELADKKKMQVPGLPVGWEKKLDPSTGRYYFIDHNKQTTHWQAPEPAAGSPKPDGRYTTKLKDESDAPSSGGLKRSHSSPNIAKMMQDGEDLHQTWAANKPSVDRKGKPKPQVQRNPMPHDVYAARQRNLNPTFGNVGRGLTGLRNLGNTCYMNSIIQSLNTTTPLVTYFLSDSYKLDLNRTNFLGSGGEVAEEFAVIIKALWSGQYRSISPGDFKSIVSKHNPMFAGYQQQDSQEFLSFIMDGLHEDLNKIKQRPKIPEQDNDNLADDIAAEKAWNLHKKVNESIIVELFQGQFKSTVTCLTCGKKSVTFDAFMYLSLPLLSTSNCKLEDCLKLFSQAEKMTGESRWRCPKCKVLRDAEKRMCIWKLPHILLIHLKRFYHDGMWRQKISSYVDFPRDGLDLRSYVVGPQTRKPYSLYAVSNHYGTMEGGHYTAFCKNPINHKWCKFDDHEVYDISASDIKTSAAYTLFYTSIDMKPPLT